MDSGSESETEQLIKAVEIRPFLYDKKHEKYKKVYLKKQAWEMIAATISSFEDSSAAERRWNSLRGKYSTEMLRIKSGDLGSGQPTSKWKYFDSLVFLKDHVNPRTNINQGFIPLRQNNSNSWSPMNDFAAGLNNTESSATEQYYNNLLNLFTNNDDSSMDNGNELEEKRAKKDESPKVQKHSNNHAAIPVKKRTSAHIFGDYVGESLAEIGEDESLEAQMKIMQILMEYKKKSE